MNMIELTGYPSVDRPWLKNWPLFLLEGRKRYERIIDNIQAYKRLYF